MTEKTDEFIKSLFFLVFFVIVIGVFLKDMNAQSDKHMRNKYVFLSMI